MDKKYILYGAGVAGKRVLQEVGNNKIAFFCDNGRAGSDIDGIEIISKERLKEIHAEYAVVISVEKRIAFEEISRSLEKDSIPWMSIQDLLIKEGFDLTKAKYESEFGYWKQNFGENDREFINRYYREIMLSIADKREDVFDGKIVADFGCGPRGSLTWMRCAKERIGIDVLAKEYLSEFGKDIISQNMIYVTSDERYIPIPSEYIDVLVSINSLDHVSDLQTMCSEIKRIIKPRGVLLGSFNLFEPATESEPQVLTEENLKEYLFDGFDIQSYRLAFMDPVDVYKNIKNEYYIEKPNGEYPCILWVMARKKG